MGFGLALPLSGALSILPAPAKWVSGLSLTLDPTPSMASCGLGASRLLATRISGAVDMGPFRSPLHGGRALFVESRWRLLATVEVQRAMLHITGVGIVFPRHLSVDRSHACQGGGGILRPGANRLGPFYLLLQRRHRQVALIGAVDKSLSLALAARIRLYGRQS